MHQRKRGIILELKELTDKALDLLGIKSTNDMSERLLETVINNDNEVYDKFAS